MFCKPRTGSIGPNGAERWESRCQEYELEIADLAQEVEDLDTAKREIDSKLDDVKAEELQDTRNNIAMLESNKENIGLSLARNVGIMDGLQKNVNELEGQIRAQVQREREAQDHQACQQTATILVQVLEKAYTKIQDDQVRELNTEMRHLFAKMAANVSDEDFGDYHRYKASLRMIQEVGLQRLPSDVDKFEIFAHNHRGRPMPPSEINGASRRILALSFVLALCKVSKTYGAAGGRFSPQLHVGFGPFEHPAGNIGNRKPIHLVAHRIRPRVATRGRSGRAVR